MRFGSKLMFDGILHLTVLYQVLNKQVPVPVPLVVQVPVQVLCINYRHSVTLQLHKVKVVVSFTFKQDAELSQRPRRKVRYSFHQK